MRFALGLLLIVAASSVSNGETVFYRGIMEYNGDSELALDDIVEGDQFEFQFAIDHDTTDNDGATDRGTFPNAVVSFDLYRVASNTGLWDPSTAAFTGGPVSIDSEPSIADPTRFSMWLGFDALTVDMEGLEVTPDFMLMGFGDAAPSVVSDTGSGQRLSDQITGGTFDPDVFSDGVFVFFVVPPGESRQATFYFDITSISIVPEPATAQCLLAGFLVLLARRRIAA